MIRILQGVDIVPVSKIKAIMLARPEFASDIFTGGEREYCFSRPDPYVHLAGRFAAKEALLKALGTGFSGSGTLREVEVVAEKSGRPALRLSGWTEKIGRRKKVSGCAVSISHAGDFAIASVILTAAGSGGRIEQGEGP
jgi:holo-[acyl-carrier protein] synthase